MSETPEWAPSAETINALPEPVRRYVMWLETHRDPSHTLQELWNLRKQVRELEAMLLREREGR